MEPADIANIVFELTRTKLDRVMMEYEDQLSYMSRQCAQLQRENEKSTTEAVRSKRLYSKARDILLENVNKFAHDQSISADLLPPLVKGALTNSTAESSVPEQIHPHHTQRNTHQTLNSPSFVHSAASFQSDLCSASEINLTISPIQIVPSSPFKPHNNNRNSSTSTTKSSKRSHTNSRIYEDVVRNKDEREGMQGYECSECRAWHKVLVEQGLVENMQEAREHKKRCCRHKFRYTPEATPEGFWDLTVPDYSQVQQREQQQQRCIRSKSKSSSGNILHNKRNTRKHKP